MGKKKRCQKKNTSITGCTSEMTLKYWHEWKWRKCPWNYVRNGHYTEFIKEKKFVYREDHIYSRDIRNTNKAGEMNQGKEGRSSQKGIGKLGYQGH